MFSKVWRGLGPNGQIVAAVVVLVGVWMLSGLIFPSAKTPEAERPAAVQANVEATASTSQPYTRTLQIVGRTEADDKATVAARTSGIVEELAVERGAHVKVGQTLARLDEGKRRLQVQAARAELASAKKLADSARALAQEGYIAASLLAEREAREAAAQQNLALMQQELGFAKITAPLTGVVEDVRVSVGDFVNVGTPLFTVVAPDDVLAVADVGQTERDQLTPGTGFTATLVNGQTVAGTLGFVAADANLNTRTFRIEGRLTPAAGEAVPTGMTATLNVPLAEVDAHEIPHTWLVVGSGGQVAVVVVATTSSGTVARKTPVELLSDTPGRAWVAGLPAGTVSIISRGQAALTDGAPISITTSTPGGR